MAVSTGNENIASHDEFEGAKSFEDDWRYFSSRKMTYTFVILPILLQSRMNSPCSTTNLHQFKTSKVLSVVESYELPI
ncbi:hypothetical protein KIN20_028457 [Parelaphostrongylus tenuis]|uniref:Uncharacterized protein n=1 Tax=Parelaphostrongylus tenuis TaxID=148309 RepID=A0AAD5R0S1_PARTN|nr:hypothetical protein KIN20_028457 [Parelaphostrongylus tenuis]